MSYFASMRSKMGDLKDKLSDRQKKVGLLPADDEKLEKTIFGMRDAYQTLLKRGQECHVVDERKISQLVLGNRMIAASEQLESDTFKYTNAMKSVLEIGQLSSLHLSDYYADPYY
eukprot:TRINITY_DN10748_c0_g1_i6.p2 TRINITY_DN10748_c0_g1~~TRINITY_DN10748_c0_g1_i6.p2  ORF type:complete len:115 (+),score=16.72 TRINITY_DN10748_c0_g1_i6:1192-1536(+)